MSIDNRTAFKPLSTKGFGVLALLPAFFLVNTSAMAAIIVGAGENVTVGPTDPLSDYVVEKGGALNLVGATTQSLSIRTGSTLNIDGAVINSNKGDHGISVNSSQATIRSAVVTADGRALWVNRPPSSTQGSTVTASDSQFRGGESGALVTGLSTLTLLNSELRGVNAGSVGLDSRGGDVRALADTLISGDSAGVRMTNDSSRVGRNSLVLDNSTVEGRNGPAILVEGGVQGATIDVRNNAVLRAADGNLLTVQGASTAAMNIVGSALEGNVKVLGNSSVDLSFDGASMVGDIVREDGSSAQVDLNNVSSFTGRLNNSNLSINSQSSLTMVGDDSIDNLSMNDGTLNFGAAGEQRDYRQLEVGNLQGSGIIAMQGNFATGESDLLKAASATGSFELAVNASGTDAASPQSLTLVQVGSNQATFALLGGRVDLGTWEYDLAERANASGGTDFYLNPTTRLSSSAQSVVALFQTALTVSYGETKSLENRMSELQADDRLHGVWVRPYGNKYNVDDGSGVGYRQQQQGFSMGADTRLGDSRWRLGLLAGYSQSDLDLHGGTSATVDSYYVGPYFGWLNPDNGYYVDGALKFNHFRNDSKVTMSDGTRAKGDYSNSGVSALVEAGRHINLGNDWFAKPSAQVSAARIEGADYRLDNGMEADGDHIDSLRTKLGVSAGRSIKLERDVRVRPYASVAVIHEFASNDDNVRVNGNSLNNDLSGSGLEFGMGVTVSLSESMRLDAGVDYFKGNDVEQPVAARLGWSYQW